MNEIENKEIQVQRAPDGRFLPGATLNPSGRPKGSINKVSIKLANYLRARAADDFEEIYQGILEKARRGDPWANTLFIKELVPQKYKEDRIQNLISAEDSTNDLLANLMKMLASPDDYSVTEAASLLKIVNSVKLTESVEKETLASKLPNDKLVAIMKMLQEDQLDKMEEDSKSE